MASTNAHAFSPPDEPIPTSVHRAGEWIEAPSFEFAPSRSRSELLRTDLHWVNDAFFQPPASAQGRRVIYSYALVNAAASTSSGPWEAAASLGAMVNFADSAQLSALSINAPEAYFGRRVGSFERGQMKVFFGRKLQDWNRADSIWHLGMVEPRFRWDPLRPERNGLTGLHAEAKFEVGPANLTERRQIAFAAFASPLYIPESGPSYSIQDGQFVSANPFFTAPPSTIDLFQQKVPVRYHLDLPPVSQIVLQPSFGFMARADYGPFWLKAAYLYKTLNSPLVSYDGGLNVAVNVTQVELRPLFPKHHQFSVDAGFDRGPARPWVSFLWDRPEQPQTGSLWTVQQAPPGGLGAVGADFSLPKRWSLMADTTARVSYLSTLEGAGADKGRLAVSNGSLFESRYPYRQAAMFELRVPHLFGHRAHLATNQRLIREFVVGGFFWSGDLVWSPRERLSASLGLDLLASSLDRTSDGGADFLGTYRGFDRVRVGVSYAF